MTDSRSDLVDPAIVLAVRDEVARGNAPVLARLDAIDKRLGDGQTKMAILELRVEDCEKQPKTDRVSKQRMSVGDKLWLAIALAAAGSIGGALGSGLISIMHKGTP